MLPFRSIIPGIRDSLTPPVKRVSTAQRDRLRRVTFGPPRTYPPGDPKFVGPPAPRSEPLNLGALRPPPVAAPVVRAPVAAPLSIPRGGQPVTASYLPIEETGAAPFIGGRNLDAVRKPVPESAVSQILGAGIPYANEAAKAVRGGIEATAPVMRVLPQTAIAQNVGERLPYVPTPSGVYGGVADALIPRQVWEVALELIPGIGTVPDLQRAVRAKSPEAIAAVRRALRDPRAQEAIAGARKALASESGKLSPGERSIQSAINKIEQQMDSPTWTRLPQSARDAVGARLSGLQNELTRFRNAPMAGQVDMFSGEVAKAPEPPLPLKAREGRQTGMFDELPPIGGGTTPPEFMSLPADRLDFDPRMQARAVASGTVFDPRVVKQIVGNFDPDLLTALDVVPTPGQPGRYTVLGGHHRTAALKELGVEAPVRVHNLDISDPAQLRRAMTIADASNATQRDMSLKGLINIINRAGTEDVGQLRAKYPRFNDQQIVDAQYTALLPSHVIDKLDAMPANAPQIGIAAEVGRGAKVYGLTADQGEGLFNKFTAGPRNAMPTRSAVREAVDLYGPKMREANVGSAQGGMFGADEVATNPLVDAMVEHARLTKVIDTSKKQLARDIAGARRIGVGKTDPAIVKAESKLAGLEAERDQLDRTFLDSPKARASSTADARGNPSMPSGETLERGAQIPPATVSTRGSELPSSSTTRQIEPSSALPGPASTENIASSIPPASMADDEIAQEIQQIAEQSQKSIRQHKPQPSGLSERNAALIREEVRRERIPSSTTGAAPLRAGEGAPPVEPSAVPPAPGNSQTGAGDLPPAKPPVDEGPVGLPERQRVSKLIAGGVERQGPEFVQQEAMRSQERSQRAAQVRKIRNDPTLSPEERNRAWRSALAGEYRKGEFTPLEISDSDFDIAEKMITESGVREFEWVNALVALSRLKNGQHVREFEQRLLGEVFGPELVAAIKARNQSLAANVAQTWGISAEDVQRAARAEEVTRPVDTVRKSALDTGEEVAMRKLAAGVGEAHEKTILAGIKKQAQQDAKELREMNNEIARSSRQMVRETDKASRDTTEGLAERARTSVSDHMANLKKIANPTPEQKAEIARLQRLIDNGAEDTVAEAVRYWSEGNRAILDGVGETQGMGQMLRLVQSAFSGQVTDSYVARLASRRAFLEMALLREGLDPKDVGKIGDLMLKSEVTQRFGNTIPANVQTSLDMLKGLGPDSTTGTILEAMARGSEEVKNLMFGLDLGVFGIQARAAVQGGWIPELAALVNKTLTRMHLPSYGDLYLDTTLDRQTANILDGLFHGRGKGAIQGPEAITDRGVVMSIPGYGKVVDKLTDFQFGTVLGGVRDTLYEGNLLLLHVLRRDIKNPQVRARAAEWANTLTGFAQGAQTARRKKVERAFFISPSMTRAQFNEILSAGKLLSPTADPEQRILAALAIASYGVSWLAAGKLINDVVGIKDFEFDPTKPGAGTITAKIPGMGETSVPFMANASLKRTFAQSLRALAETDPESLTNAWLRYVTAREATSGRVPTGLLTGRGYTPEGKFSTDLSREDLAKSLIPAPPVVQSAITEGLNPVRQGLETLGVNNYPRSTFDKADEKIATAGDWRAALKAEPEGDVRDIIKYRGRQEFLKEADPLGLYVVPGELGRSPQIEFRQWDKVEREAAQAIADTGVVPKGEYDGIAEVRAAYIARLMPALLRGGLGEKEASQRLTSRFNALPGVKNITDAEKRYRLNFWKRHAALLDDAQLLNYKALSEDEEAISVGAR